MKLLEMGKDVKVKDSVSSPSANYGGTFFVKKLCILGKLMEGCFTWGLMIR